MLDAFLDNGRDGELALGEHNGLGPEGHRGMKGDAVRCDVVVIGVGKWFVTAF